ncbi:MAG: hypothetical protein IPK13_07220 [Deltaproteobacteria bacterium]|nr:hypothetical protein [Deltaproteobacteria bacterium]
MSDLPHVLGALGPATRSTLAQSLADVPKAARAVLMQVLSTPSLMTHVNRAHADSPLLAREPEVTGLMQSWADSGRVDRRKLKEVLSANGLWTEGFLRALPGHFNVWAATRRGLIDEAEAITEKVMDVLGTKRKISGGFEPRAKALSGRDAAVAAIHKELVAIADQVAKPSPVGASPVGVETIAHEDVWLRA